jgi:hypothetical protein
MPAIASTAEMLRTVDATAAHKRAVATARESLHVPPGHNRVDTVLIPAYRGKPVLPGDIAPGTLSRVLEELLAAKIPHRYTYQYNARVQQGASWQAALMFNAAGVPASYLAISTDTAAVANTDTALTSELTTNGLARAAGTYALNSGQGSIGGTAQAQLTKTWTYTGSTSVVVAKIAACTTSTQSASDCRFIALFNATATVNQNGDQLAATYQFTI